MKSGYTWRYIPEGAVVVTKKEREALNAHQEKVWNESIEAIFDDVEELLTGGMKFGCSYETLIADLHKVKQKYIEREEKC